MTVEAEEAGLAAEAQQHLEQAYTYEEEGKLEEALQRCELAIALTPNLADAYNLQGIILEQLGHREQAIAAYREAVRLEPDFEEAKQNLYEAQDEIRELRQALEQKQAWKVAFWGALGYGISFAIIGAVLAVLNVTQRMPGGRVTSPKYGFCHYLVIATLLYALGSGVGTAVIGKASGSSKTRLLSLIGALGFGIAYLVTAVPGRILESLISFFNPYPSIETVETIHTVIPTVQFAVTGVFTWFLIGLVQTGARQSVWSALAGGAFGLQGLSSSLAHDLALSIMFSGLVPGSLGDVTHDSIVMAIAYSVRGALVGGVSGALLGLIMGQPKSDNDRQTEAV